MPREKRLHSTINYQVDLERPLPMVNMLINRIQPGLAGNSPIIQTINPFVLPPDEKVLSLINLQRPIVDMQTMEAQKDLASLQREDSDRRLWFCGSYADYGIPLQESASASALWVAEEIGGQPRPWKTNESERMRLERRWAGAL